ncbi:MAG TPA: hypothetical protein VKS01_10920, partial [Bryobacteraceae bacterium]|nr:hypothetical protein [Bryobacteraceae bacterium]
YQNTLLRAQAGIAFLERRLDDAEKLARRSMEYCDQLDDRGAVQVIREKTEELIAEIAAARLNGLPGSAGRADPARSRH